jgi:hypothetical protein
VPQIAIHRLALNLGALLRFEISECDRNRFYFATCHAPLSAAGTRLTNQNVAASTQNQAFSALLFLYRDVLKQGLPWIDNIERAKRPAKVPVVLTPEEVACYHLEVTRDLSINGTTSLWLWPSRHGVCTLAR